MILQNLDPDLNAYLDGLAHDGMDIFTLEDHQVRGAVLHATTLVNRMRANHGLGILETLALGYGYMAGLLCSMQLKGQDRLALSIQGDGPMRSLQVDVQAGGRVRGYLGESVFPVSAPVESFDLRPYIGEASLSLTRLYEGAREPVTGTTRMAHGDMARDLAVHFKESEQTHTAFTLSIHFDREGVVRGAGALMLQAMPGADETLLLDLDDWLPQVPGLGKAYSQGMTGPAWLHSNFRAFRPQVLGTRAAEFHCSCQRQGFLDWLLGMEDEKRRELALEGPMPMEVQCHNCGTRYHYDENDLRI